jgi:hypothetical protein
LDPGGERRTEADLTYFVYVQKRDAPVRYMEVLPERDFVDASLHAARVLAAHAGAVCAELWSDDELVEKLEIVREHA